MDEAAGNSSFLAHALVLGWRPGDVLAILRAHFEEPSPVAQVDDVVVGIGGLVATCAAWSEFNTRWQAALDSEGVNVLRMKQLRSGRCAPYRGWHAEKTTGFLLRLMDAISHAEVPLGAMKRLSFDPDKRDHVGQAYRRACVESMKSALSRVPADGTIHFVFARSPEISQPLLDQYYGWVITAYTRVREDGRVGQLVLGDPGDLPPLQAADLIASELARHTREPDAVPLPVERLRRSGRLIRT